MFRRTDPQRPNPRSHRSHASPTASMRLGDGTRDQRCRGARPCRPLAGAATMPDTHAPVGRLPLEAGRRSLAAATPVPLTLPPE